MCTSGKSHSWRQVGFEPRLLPRVLNLRATIDRDGSAPCRRQMRDQVVVSIGVVWKPVQHDKRGAPARKVTDVETAAITLDAVLGESGESVRKSVIVCSFAVGNGARNRGGPSHAVFTVRRNVTSCSLTKSAASC